MIQTLMGDVRERLNDIEDGTVQSIITSIPYYGQRAYTEDPREIGHEPSPKAFVDTITEVFHLARPKLRRDGVLLLNVGDGYVAGGGTGGGMAATGLGSPGKVNRLRPEATDPERFARWKRDWNGLKNKDLLGMPWAVATALRADGWYLRREIIWAKGVSGQKELLHQVAAALELEGVDTDTAWRVLERLDPYVGGSMPESVDDRPSSSHEYVFLLTPSDRYYWDKAGIAESSVMRPQRRYSAKGRANGHASDGWNEPRLLRDTLATDGGSLRNRRSVWCIPTVNERRKAKCAACSGFGYDSRAALLHAQDRVQVLMGRLTQRNRHALLRALRDAFPCLMCKSSGRVGEDHYAVWPEALVEPLILASTSLQACEACGAPWRRVIEKTGALHLRKETYTPYAQPTRVSSTAWSPSTEPSNVFAQGCGCAGTSGTGRCTVLDPFAGSGTTLRVAERLGRESIGIDLAFPDIRDRRLASIQTEAPWR